MSACPNECRSLPRSFPTSRDIWAAFCLCEIASEVDTQASQSWAILCVYGESGKSSNRRQLAISLSTRSDLLLSGSLVSGFVKHC